MSICPKCKSANPDGADFCLVCGSHIDQCPPTQGRGAQSSVNMPTGAYTLTGRYREGIGKSHTVISIILVALAVAAGIALGVLYFINRYGDGYGGLPYVGSINYIVSGVLGALILFYYRSISITTARNSVQIGKNTETQVHILRDVLTRVSSPERSASERQTQELLRQLIAAQNESNARLAEQQKTMQAMLASFGVLYKQSQANNEALVRQLEEISRSEQKLCEIISDDAPAEPEAPFDDGSDGLSVSVELPNDPSEGENETPEEGVQTSSPSVPFYEHFSDASNDSPLGETSDEGPNEAPDADDDAGRCSAYSARQEISDDREASGAAPTGNAADDYDQTVVIYSSDTSE